MATDGPIECSVITPEEKVLEARVSSVVIPAHDGQVGLAPSRAPLLAQLGDGMLRLDFEEGGSRYFFVGGGFAQMKDNNLSIVADEAIPAEDIVKQTAEEELAAAQAIKTNNDEQIDAKLRAIDKARSKIAIYKQLDGRI